MPLETSFFKAFLCVRVCACIGVGVCHYIMEDTLYYKIGLSGKEKRNECVVVRKLIAIINAGGFIIKLIRYLNIESV